MAFLATAAASLAASAATPVFRSEVHTLATLTLTSEQVRAGVRDAASTTTIAGELRLPFGDVARFPAVLMLHGDAGQLASQAVWTEELNALGIAVFTLDSFSARGAIATGASLATMPGSVGATARVVDAERALALLAAHPLDPARIAVMGFSSGGRTAMLLAQTRFASIYGRPGTGFAAYVAPYPDCNTRLLGDTRVEPGPQRVFIGEADVLTDAGACTRYVARLKQAGADAVITTYPGAHHAFDSRLGPKLVRIPGVPIAAAATWTKPRPGSSSTSTPAGSSTTATRA